jgi:phosphoglycolate phosphatase
VVVTELVEFLIVSASAEQIKGGWTAIRQLAAFGENDKPYRKPGEMTPKVNRFSAVRALIFDLDGTLIDSKLDLALSVNAMLDHMGRTQHVHETIFGFVGNGAEALVRKSLGEGVADEDVKRGLAYFLSYYRSHMLDNTVLYPGVVEALEHFRELGRYSLAVFTNKPVHFSRAIIEGLNLTRYFVAVYGGNSFERKKPDPMGIEVLLGEMEASRDQAMMVGDSQVDIQTARNSGIFACGVTYGFDLAGLRVHPPDIMVDNLVELPQRLSND